MKNKRIRVRFHLRWVAMSFVVFSVIATAASAEDKDAMIDQAMDAVENSELAIPVPAVSAQTPFDPTVGVLDFQDQDILDVLRVIGEKTRLNIAADDHIRGRVTVYLNNVDVWDALRTILEMHGLAYVAQDNQVTVMTGDEFAVLHGRKFNEKVRTQLVPLAYVDPEEMLAVLAPHQSEKGKVILIEKTKNLLLIDEPGRVETMVGLLKDRDVALETRVFVLRHVGVPDIKTKIEKLLSPVISTAIFNERLNQITVTDAPGQLNIIGEQIAALDKEIEVAFVGQIIQIQLDQEHQQGIDWEAIVSHYKPIGISLPQGISVADASREELSVGTIVQEDLSVLKESLGTAGTMEILGTPSVTIKAKQEAGIPLSLANPFQLRGAKLPAASTPLRFHLELAIMPAAVEEHVVRLKLNPQFHWLADGSTAIPVTSSSMDVSLQDGEMIVLGGLFQEERTLSEKKNRWVGDLPIIGPFFNKQQNIIKRTEFVIFLTPKVLVEKEEPPAAGK